MPWNVQTPSPLLEELLDDAQPILGKDFPAYRNHAWRVFHLCRGFRGVEDRAVDNKIAVAAFFHDLGIWTDDTLDYLDPSAQMAAEYLLETGRSGWVSEVGRMIQEHHRVEVLDDPKARLIEAFRRADWVDVSFGLRESDRPGSPTVPPGFLKRLRQAYPTHGFHRRMLLRVARRLRTHPRDPLPMIRRG